MLISKIRKKKFIVGVIGLGYVGLPRSIQFCNKKIKVIGFDNDKDKINQLNKGKSYLTNVTSKDIYFFYNITHSFLTCIQTT